MSLTRHTKVKKEKPSVFASLTTKKGKMRIMSIAAGVAVMIAAVQIAGMVDNNTVRDMGIMGGIMVMVIPISITQVREHRRRDSIDANLPIFLLALVSSVQSGASLLRAVEDAADRDMGTLTPELRNLRANISWGTPYHEAFDHFITSVGTQLARRVGILLQISMDIGGDVVGTLELIQTHVSEMQNIEKERKSQLAPYIYTIYISFVVFLAITLILVSQFFTEIETVQDNLRETAERTGADLGMFGSILGIRVNELTSIMFTMALVEAVFGGIAAGKIGEGSFVAGIKHVIIMIIMSVIAFAAVGGI